jgi:hypothetical protein
VKPLYACIRANATTTQCGRLIELTQHVYAGVLITSTQFTFQDVTWAVAAYSGEAARFSSLRACEDCVRFVKRVNAA